MRAGVRLLGNLRYEERQLRQQNQWTCLCVREWSPGSMPSSPQSSWISVNQTEHANSSPPRDQGYSQGASKGGEEVQRNSKSARAVANTYHSNMFQYIPVKGIEASWPIEVGWRKRELRRTGAIEPGGEKNARKRITVQKSEWTLLLKDKTMQNGARQFSILKQHNYNAQIRNTLALLKHQRQSKL